MQRLFYDYPEQRCAYYRPASYVRREPLAYQDSCRTDYVGRYARNHSWRVSDWCDTGARRAYALPPVERSVPRERANVPAERCGPRAYAPEERCVPVRSCYYEDEWRVRPTYRYPAYERERPFCRDMVRERSCCPRLERSHGAPLSRYAYPEVRTTPYKVHCDSYRYAPACQPRDWPVSDPRWSSEWGHWRAPYQEFERSSVYYRRASL